MFIRHLVNTEIHGINRYMLGCKYEVPAEVEQGTCGINRYMLGCKFLHTVSD